MRRPIKKLKKYWKALQLLEEDFSIRVSALENIMEDKTGIEGIEFYWCDGYCGIGTADKKMKLIHQDELE